MIGFLHTDGSGEQNPPLERLSDLFDELLTADQEHGDVAVSNYDIGWRISAHRDARVILSEIGKRRPRHMIPITKETVLDLWTRLARGEIESILSEPWKPGYTENSPKV
jgi:hypothetical protein